MKVLFLTEAGFKIGNGHLNRCTALADGFDSLGWFVTFCIREEIVEYSFIRNYQIVYEEWFDKAYIRNVATEYDVIIVDSYLASQETLDFIAGSCKLPVFLIDSTLKFSTLKGCILFPSVYANDFQDQFNTGNQLLLLGSDYLLFTREFWSLSYQRIGDDIRNVGISMGATDSIRINYVIKNLRDILTSLNRISVFGKVDVDDNSNKLVSVKGALEKTKYIQEISKLDLLITNGGQTLNEALALGVPTLSLITVNNQERNVNAYAQLGLTISQEFRNEISENLFAEKIQTLVAHEVRLKMANLCHEMIPKDGAIKAANAIINFKLKRYER